MPSYQGSGQATVTTTGAVTSDTSVVVTFPNGIAVIPKRVRASGSVSGPVKLNIAGQQIIVNVNPNASEQFAMIPKGTYKNPTTEVNLDYQASGAGSLYVTVDY
jgi:hypothetical protein